jgi:hypothetical protein
MVMVYTRLPVVQELVTVSLWVTRTLIRILKSYSSTTLISEKEKRLKYVVKKGLIGPEYSRIQLILMTFGKRKKLNTITSNILINFIT